MTKEQENKIREEIENRFKDLGSYSDHAPNYTHPEGECTICPIEIKYSDDIADYFINLINQRDKELIEKILKIPTEKPERESDEYDVGLKDMKQDIINLIK